jgi:exonuclease III
MQELFNRYCSAIKQLPSPDQSESRIIENTAHSYGMVNVLDYSENKGEEGSRLEITVKFANFIDLSEVEIEHVIIQGRVNIADLSGAKIKKLDRRELQAVKIDFSESEIEEDVHK